MAPRQRSAVMPNFISQPSVGWIPQMFGTGSTRDVAAAAAGPGTPAA